VQKDNQQLKELLDIGMKRGFLSYDEILFALTDSHLSEEEIGEFYNTLQDKGITIVEDNAFDEDDYDDELFWQFAQADNYEDIAQFAPKDQLEQILHNKKRPNALQTIAQTQQKHLTPLELYLQEAAQINPLNEQEEDQLFAQAAAGDSQAAEMLLQHSQYLVVGTAAEFAEADIPFLDLVQEGNMALYECISKPDTEFPYWVQAVWWIKQYLHHFTAAEKNIIRIPSQIAEDIKSLQKKEHQLEHQLGREALAEELAKELDWHIEQVEEMRQIIKNPELLAEYLAQEAETPVQEQEDDYWQEEEETAKTNNDLLLNMQKRAQSRQRQSKYNHYHK